jgi:ferredoxin-nitrite reductase
VTSATTEKVATANKFEKLKAEKDGLAVKSELEQFAQVGWEAMDATDRDHRLKWLGIFSRPATPGKFMMRLRMPSGIANASQLRAIAEIVQRYGEDGCADITTRQNIQMRGIRFEDTPDILRRLSAVEMTSVQSGMDNVRNITASPVAGLDADELIDVRDLVQQVQDMITNYGEGNPEFTNLPRKFNIAIEGGRDNSIHAEINDVAFVPAYKSSGAQDLPTSGFWYIWNKENGIEPGERRLGFNVVVGGFFSAKRCEAAIPMNVWVAPEQVVALCRAILEVFRDNGPRANRQKSRLMWLIDEWGIDRFRSEVEQQMGQSLEPAADKDEMDWEKRDHIGVYKQKQSGLNYVGLNVPVGRLFADDLFELARLAEVYGSGEVRCTVEQNVILTNVPDSRLETLLSEPLLQKFSIAPGRLVRSLVSCTGAQFCNFALIETKNRAKALMEELQTEVELSQPVRIHWTGCPNSCGQPQVADIGFMGTKARKNGKAVDGVDIFMGGKVGKDAHLGTVAMKAVPCEDLKPVLRKILVEQFNARLKEGVVIEADLPVADQPSVKAKPATIVFAKSGKEVACTEADSILEVAEQAGISLDSSCQSGSCGTCKQQLVEGKVTYSNPPTGLSDSEQASGYVLTCSAHPTGKVVVNA